ncbi:MAG: tetratricopeptide repeat protein [Polyangiaceae bacterium]
MDPKAAKRLAYLEKITTDGSTDPFHWYCLAQEYRSQERNEDAATTFEKLEAMMPDYVPMFLMAGQLFEKMGKVDAAKAWLDKGMVAAKKKGDSHALGELEAARALLA